MHYKIESTHGKGSKGLCRRFPPLLIDLKDLDRAIYLQPTVRGSDHCGEFASGTPSKAYQLKREEPAPDPTPDGLPW